MIGGGRGGRGALHIKGPESLIFYRLDLNSPGSKVAIKIQLNLQKASY